MTRRLTRATWAMLAASALYIVLVWTAMARKSETYDEGLFVALGTAQIRTGNPNLDISHPPLLRWLGGLLPALVGGATAPQPIPFVSRGLMQLEDPGPIQRPDFDYGPEFFYHAGNRYPLSLFLGRLPFVTFGVALGWLVFLVSRKLFGARSGLAAGVIVLFLPEVLAHGQWAHSDLASAAAFFLLAAVLALALSRDRGRFDLALGLAFGFAIAIKFTAIVLAPILLVALPAAGGIRRGLRGVSLLAAGAALAVIVAYLPEPRLFGHALSGEDLAASGLARVAPLVRAAPLPDSFLKGLVFVRRTAMGMGYNYFHGRTRQAGWWYYFPAAFLMKYPPGFVLLALAGLAAFVVSPVPLALRMAFTLIPAALFLSGMLQHTDIGVRAILPIAPFAALWIAAILARGRRSWTGPALLVLAASSVASGLAAYPDFLAYFTPLLGGNRQAGRWLSDSNLDWGQDLPALAREIERRHIDRIHLAYFGLASPEAYGITRVDPEQFEAGWYAISRTYLAGLYYGGRDPFRPFRALTPETYVGGSIALFHVQGADLRELAESEMQAGREALGSGQPGDAVRHFLNVLALRPDECAAEPLLARSLEAAGERSRSEIFWRAILERAEQSSAEARRHLASPGP